MAFFSFMEGAGNAFASPFNVAKQGVDSLGNQPQRPNSFWGGQMGDPNPGVYSMEEQARDQQMRKQQRHEAEQAAFQKQANPLDPSFVQGLAPQPGQNPGGVIDWQSMQRGIYG